MGCVRSCDSYMVYKNFVVFCRIVGFGWAGACARCAT